MLLRRLTIAVAVLALAAGCTGDDDFADTTIPSVSNSATVPTTPTTTAGTRTTVSATTTTLGESSTSLAETTVPSSTVLTPGATLPADDLAANSLAIVETVNRSFEIYSAALSDPFNEAKVEALALVNTPRLLEGWMNIIDDFRENNFRSVPRSENPARYDVDVNSLQVNLTNGTASIQACYLDSSIKVETGGNADGTDRVVDDGIVERVEQLELVRQNGQWKIDAAGLPDESEIVTSCG